MKVLLLVAFLTLTARAADGPDIAKIVARGCLVGNPSGSWVVRVWADYDEAKKPPAGEEAVDVKHDYQLLYSTRPKRLKALEDCDKWLRETDKKIDEAKKKNGQSHAKERKIP
jgi:hypothetical protein